MLIPAHSDFPLSPDGLPKATRKPTWLSPGDLIPRFSWSISPCSEAMPRTNLRGPHTDHFEGSRVGNRQQARSQAGIWLF